MRRELRVGNLHRDDGCKAFTSIITGSANFCFFGHPLALDIAVETSGQGCSKSSQVRPSIPLRNIVGIAENIFLKAVVPLQSNLNANPSIGLCLKMTDLVDTVFSLVEKIYKGIQPAVVTIGLTLTGTLIAENDADPTIQKSQLPQTFSKDIKMELDIGKCL